MRRILRALIYDLDPRPVELLASQISLWFAVVLTQTTTSAIPQPRWFWTIWCFVAAFAKVAGVLPSLLSDHPPRWSAWCRLVGAALGAFFWLVLAGVLVLLVPGGIGWGAFLILSGAQGWVLYRLGRSLRRNGWGH